MPYRILIAEDHYTFRQGLARLLAAHNIQPSDISEVSSAKELLLQLNAKTFTHLVLDLQLSDGPTFSLIPRIRKKFPFLQILIYSQKPAAIFRAKLWEQYRAYYLSKNEQEVATQQKLIKFLKNKDGEEKEEIETQNNPFASLTPKEKEIVEYLLDGWSPAKIAIKIKMNQSTLRTHKSNLMTKVGATNVVELKELASLFLYQNEPTGQTSRRSK